MRRLRTSEVALSLFAMLCLLLAVMAILDASAAREERKVLDVHGLADRHIEFTTDFYGLEYRGVANNLIDLHVFQYGAFEKPVLHWLRDTAARLDSEDLTYVDVGANIGHHALFMSQIASHVHAIEPYLPVLARLRDAVERNQLDNVTIHPVGLGAAADELEFFEPPDDNHGTGSFVRNYQGRSPDTTRLKIVRGDDYFAANAIEGISLLKIDVEGYEKDVLTGLAETLAANRPIVIMELTVGSEDQLFKSRDELVSAFPDGYEFRLLEPEGQYADWTGEYAVRAFSEEEPTFTAEGQWSIIAHPAEDAGAVPLGGGGTD